MDHYYLSKSWFIYIDEYLTIESVVCGSDGKLSKSMENGEFNN